MACFDVVLQPEPDTAAPVTGVLLSVIVPAVELVSRIERLAPVKMMFPVVAALVSPPVPLLMAFATPRRRTPRLMIVFPV